MDSNEEYLDQLLKSLTEENSSGATGQGGGPDQDDGLEDLLNQFSDDMDNVPEDLLNGLLSGLDNPSEELPEVEQEEEPEEEPVTLSDMLQDMAKEEGPEELAEAGDISREMSLKEPDDDIMTQQPVLEDEQVGFEMPETLDFKATEESVPEMDESSVSGTEEDDLGSLLESLGADGDEDAQEISELLDKADRNEPIDNAMDFLMQGLNQEGSQNEGYSGEDFLGEDDIEALLGGQGKKKKKKKERAKKEKKPRRSKKKKEQDTNSEDTIDLSEDNSETLLQETGDEPVAEMKKQGFFGKLLNVLTQEEEEDEPSDLVSDENGEILKELDKEKKQAKGKKKKNEKEKKGKDKRATEADGDEDLEDAPDAKKKKKKEKKPKKEKPPVPVEELLPGKKLSLKKVLPLVAVFVVFCLAYVMVSHLYINHVNKQRAEDAYYAGDYLECYGLLFGQDLNASQELMFHRSELILQMERMKGNYRRLVMEGKELEALDYLVQCACRREDSYLQGQEWNSLDVVEETYSGMMGLLTANYGLTEERALEIAALKSDVDYTIALLQVLEGIGSRSSGEESSQPGPATYEDMLPEEEENSNTAFIDTLG